jgi:2-amino-4-hydroxy-6-hydroxymethyldihydropteridine diphosphokinase
MTAPLAVHYYLIGLGANLGDRARNIAQALSALESDVRNTVVTCSKLWETPPHLPPDQASDPRAQPHPKYLNACAVVKSELAPDPFLELLLSTERAMGRVRDPSGPRYQPRPIDLDVILWDGGKFNSAVLELPHPRFEDRAFVLLPLQQVFTAMPAESVKQYALPKLINALPKPDVKACTQFGPVPR